MPATDCGSPASWPFLYKMRLDFRHAVSFTVRLDNNEQCGRILSTGERRRAWTSQLNGLQHQATRITPLFHFSDPVPDTNMNRSTASCRNGTRTSTLGLTIGMTFFRLALPV